MNTRLSPQIFLVAVVTCLCLSGDAASYNFFEAWPSAKTKMVGVQLQPGRAYALNDADEVVGYCASFFEAWPSKWKGYTLDWEPINLGTLSADPCAPTHATDINNYGKIVGYTLGDGGESHAFVYDESVGITDSIPLYPPGEWFRAHSINDSGKIVGVRYTLDPDYVGDGYSFFEAWPSTWEEDEAATTPAGLTGTGLAHHINAQGLLVGKSDQAQVVKPYVVGPSPSDLPTFLPTVPANTGEAFCSNDSGVIVGRCGTSLEAWPETPATYNFFEAWPSMWQGDYSAAHPLPTLGGTNQDAGCAYAVNAAGEIVGYSTSPANEQHACLWDKNGNIVDLHDMFDFTSDPDLQHVVARDINFMGMIAGWCSLRSDPHVTDAFVVIPQHKTRVVMYDNGDATGTPSTTDIDYDYLSMDDGNSLPYMSGISLPDGAYLEVVTDPSFDIREWKIIDQVLPVSALRKIVGQDAVPLVSAEYNAYGQILRVEQPNKDFCEPNEVFEFEYDALGRLMKGGPLGAIMGGGGIGRMMGQFSTGFIGNERIPYRVEHVSFTDPNQNLLAAEAEYSQGGNLISLKCKRQGHAGIIHYNFAYGAPEPTSLTFNGRGIDLNEDGQVDSLTYAGFYYYDLDGRLTRIYDAVSETDMLSWNRTAGDIPTENISLNSIYGDPNADVIEISLAPDAAGHCKIMAVRVANPESEFANITIPDNEDLPIRIRNWSSSTGPGPVSSPMSADIGWGDIVEEPNAVSDAYTMAVQLLKMKHDMAMAATIYDDAVEVCVYTDADKTRKKGIRINRDGTINKAVHFYDRADDGSTLAMIVVDEYGRALINLGKEEEEPLRYNFFEAWPSYCGDGGVTSTDDWEAPVAAMGPPSIPVYSQTGNGHIYVAGTISPKGIYHYIHYDANGDPQAIIQMNGVSLGDCTDAIAGDVSGDCRVDLIDFAMVAADWLKCNLVPQTACWD